MKTKKSKIECTVHGCLNLKQAGDSLFCSGHRHQWRKYCDTLGLDSNIGNQFLASALRTFQVVQKLAEDKQRER